MKRGLCLAGSMLLAWLLCCQARGAVLLREDWNSGRIDTARWEFAGMPINASLADLGGGDWAIIDPQENNAISRTRGCVHAYIAV